MWCLALTHLILIEDVTGAKSSKAPTYTLLIWRRKKKKTLNLYPYGIVSSFRRNSVVCATVGMLKILRKKIMDLFKAKCVIDTFSASLVYNSNLKCSGR